MPYSLQPLLEALQALPTQGVAAAVLSPGSRVAPLALALARHPQIAAYTCSDERSAAYMALGMAQQTARPVALACTSGTAALNYAPAVAEAFYLQVPLLLLTADRPPEWIGQQDGQAIQQQGLYGPHVKASFQLPSSYGHPDEAWQARRLLAEACLLAKSDPQGPVQVNVPLREPFYPEAGAPFEFGSFGGWEEIAGPPQLGGQAWDRLMGLSEQAPRILVAVGQTWEAYPALAALSEKGIPAAADAIANQHGTPAIRRHDLLLPHLPPEKKEALRPDLLVTMGLSVLSKPLKQFLRANPPRWHWHVQPAGLPADPFRCLSQVVRAEPGAWLAEWARRLPGPSSARMAYGGAWREAEARAAHAQRAGWNDAWAELTAVKEAMARLEAPWQLHLANSMAVRYANLLPLREDQGGVRVWANRGTSGIDGCTSTFMGHAIARPGKHLLITGDVAFFYDRNAFWHRYPVGQARILLLNNQGGAIFRMIDGPKQQPELEEFFVTEQRLSAEGQAAEAGWAYRAWRAGESLADAAAWLLADASDTRLLEVFSGNEQAAADLAAHREAIRGALG